MWWNIHFVYGVWTTITDVSLHMRHMPQAKTAFHPPKTMHYWWSDQRETLKHTAFPYVTVNMCVCECACVCMWLNRWAVVFPHWRGCKWLVVWNFSEPIRKRVMKAKQPLAHLCYPTSWQQPLWPITTATVSSMFFLFLLQITTFHICDAIISSICWRNTFVYSEPCNLHPHITNLYRKLTWTLFKLLFSLSE